MRFSSYARNCEPETEARMPDIVQAEEERMNLARGRAAQKLRLSREERDHIAGHALDSIRQNAATIGICLGDHAPPSNVGAASTCARRIAALSNLLGDIGWERHAPLGEGGKLRDFLLGELFPVAQLRPWLEEWQRQDDEALGEAEEALEVGEAESVEHGVYRYGHVDLLCRAIPAAQTKLGTGAILLARIEKWMASHEN
jgi:hypothetical protein